MKLDQQSSRNYAPGYSTSPSYRDTRIDFFRGIALLCIFVDHIPGNIISRLTLHNMGFSDAAELFVLLGGVSAALAYGRRPNADQLIIKRVGRIYLAHVALVLFIAGMMAVAAKSTGNPLLAVHATLLPFAEDPIGALWLTLTLRLQPAYINILPLYLMLLLWLPVSLRLARASSALALSVATLIWLFAAVCQANLSLDGGGGWFFNPLSWQLLFNIGIVIGLRNINNADGYRLPRSGMLQFLAIGFLLFSLILSAPWTQIPIPAVRQFHLLPPDLVGQVSKTYASAWRLIHVLCLAYVTACWLPRNAGWLELPWASWIQQLGRRPLIMFMLASVSSYAAGIAFMQYGKGIPMQLLCNLLGLGLLAAVGTSRHRFMRSSNDGSTLSFDRALPAQ